MRGADEPFVVDDIAYESESVRNADPCTSRGCMWPKSSDGKVYVPYVIANHYSKCTSQLDQGSIPYMLPTIRVPL